MMIVDKDDFTMPGKDRPPQSFLDLRTQQGQINWLAQFLMSVNAAFDDLEVTATIETGDEMSVTTEYDEETKTLTFHFVFTGSGGGGYVLPTMSAEVKGGAKVGSGLAMTGEALGLEGVSFTQAEKTKLAGIDEGANDYTLPIATTSELGGVKPDGTTVTVDADGTIHSAGVSEILPISRGGTGTDNETSARARLGSVTLGTCSTQSNYYPKVVTGTGFGSQNPLYAGARLAVRFVNAFISEGASSFYKLSIGDSDYDIWINGVVVSDTNPISISAGAIAEFVFDGTQFHYLGNDIDGYPDYDANQAIADNSAAIATLQQAKIRTEILSATYSVAANDSTTVIFTPTIPAGYRIVGVVAARSLNADAWVGQFGLTSQNQPYVQIYAKAAVSNNTCNVTTLLVPT